jgi:hypothetical protein
MAAPPPASFRSRLPHHRHGPPADPTVSLLPGGVSTGGSSVVAPWGWGSGFYFSKEPNNVAWAAPCVFLFDCGRVLFGSRVAEMRRRVIVHTRHQLQQARKHHKQKRASLVATEAIVVESPRTIVVVLKGTVGAPRVMAGVLLVRKWVLPAWVHWWRRRRMRAGHRMLPLATCVEIGNRVTEEGEGLPGEIGDRHGSVPAGAGGDSSSSSSCPGPVSILPLRVLARRAGHQRGRGTG